MEATTKYLVMKDYYLGAGLLRAEAANKKAGKSYGLIK